MYKKLKISLFSPAQIIELINDKWRSIWIYFFSIVLFLMIPTVIVNTMEKGMSVFQYRALSEVIKNEVRVDGKITNGILETNNNVHVKFDQFDLYIVKDKIDMQLTSTHMIILEKDKVHYLFREMPVTSSSYKEIGLENYDFLDISSKNQNIFLNSMDTFFSINKASIVSLVILVDWLGIVIDLLLVVLVISFFNFKPVPFKYKFKVNIYASTIYVLFNFFAVLFQIQFIAYIGIVLMFVYSNKAFSRVISIR
ncbi:conserved hypothetical protein (DUF1189) [Alteracholeplasma palmae J233]|uniref:DUF1189 domain-containing protein n=1 Tax=Alteracholeplasma palmae (strain ATCC 49389 / J233) TaxID=1318466 RepID=U4KKC1_ALTPJ|nr:DUF1189 family protein [Alteracholeplasma palmae]CCV63978.1 conserved hypothetical protein (DUF1189) [Alteracholeplasma palmae J233]